MAEKKGGYLLKTDDGRDAIAFKKDQDKRFGPTKLLIRYTNKIGIPIEEEQPVLKSIHKLKITGFFS